MRRGLFFVFLLALLCAAPLCAQELLPDHFGKWTALSSPLPSDPTPFGFSEQQRAILRETGNTRNEVRVYASGKRQLFATIYQLRDASGAYELFTSALEPGMIPSRLGQASAMSRGSAVVLVGNFVLGVTHLEGASLADLRILVERLPARARLTPLPPIPSYLPQKGRIPGTERYALGPTGFRAALEALGQKDFLSLTDAVGFSSSAEAVLARYRGAPKDAVLLLLEYPTPQIAGLHQKHIESALAAIKQEAAGIVRRKGSLLALVLPPASPATAHALLDAVNYETQVTWNEPSQTLTDPPWARVIVNIFVGTGVIMVAAVVFGIAFGGLRVVVKIFLPGKVFDRPKQMEIIQLGLSGKTIDASDFY